MDIYFISFSAYTSDVIVTMLFMSKELTLLPVFFINFLNLFKISAAGLFILISTKVFESLNIFDT